MAPWDIFTLGVPSRSKLPASVHPVLCHDEGSHRNDGDLGQPGAPNHNLCGSSIMYYHEYRLSRGYGIRNMDIRRREHWHGILLRGTIELRHNRLRQARVHPFGIGLFDNRRGHAVYSQWPGSLSVIMALLLTRAGVPERMGHLRGGPSRRDGRCFVRERSLYKRGDLDWDWRCSGAADNGIRPLPQRPEPQRDGSGMLPQVCSCASVFWHSSKPRPERMLT